MEPESLKKELHELFLQTFDRFKSDFKNQILSIESKIDNLKNVFSDQLNQLEEKMENSLNEKNAALDRKYENKVISLEMS